MASGWNASNCRVSICGTFRAGKVKAPVEFCEQLTREHFLRFFVSMFQKYLTFLARPCDMTRNSEPDEVFRREAFIRDQPVSARVCVCVVSVSVSVSVCICDDR